MPSPSTPLPASLSNNFSFLYEKALRALFLIMIILYPFSNLISLILSVLGVLALFSQSARKHWHTIQYRTWCIASLLLVMIALINAINSPISIHACIKELGHYLLFIPMLFIGSLFIKNSHKSQALRFLLISCSIMAVGQLTSITLGVLTSQHNTLAAALSHHSLISKILTQLTQRHTQDRGPFLAIGLLLSASQLQKRDMNHQKKQLIGHILRYLSLCLLFTIALFTQTERIGYLCFLVAIGFLGYQKLGIKGLILAAASASLLLLLAYRFLPTHLHQTMIFKQKIAGLISGPAQQQHDRSTQLRINGLAYAWDNVRYKPLLGFGVGTFHTEQPTSNFIPATHEFSVEPTYVLIALQLGLVGLLCFVIILLGYWRTLSFQTKGRAHDAQGILLILCTGALTFPLFLGSAGLAMLSIGVATQLWSVPFSEAP